VTSLFLDLDDTLYPEIDFRLGGYRAVAQWLHTRRDIDVHRVMAIVIEKMAGYGFLYRQTLSDLCATLHIAEELSKLVEIYRQHELRLVLYPDAEDFLNSWSNRIQIGLITDGNALVQFRKIQALHLENWLSPNRIYVTDALDPPTDKRSPDVFERIMHRFVSADPFVYVGDNPEKDFRHPDTLGWVTIRVMRGSHASLSSGPDVQYEIDGFGQLPKLLSELTSLTDHVPRL
jgi:putative hydrolase of the HAD superfamily